jgi:hypothetical protein
VAETAVHPITRTPAEIRDGVRAANCGHCWQRPGPACTAEGDHLARWLRAERRGMISRTELAAALADLDVIEARVIILGGDS